MVHAPAYGIPSETPQAPVPATHCNQHCCQVRRSRGVAGLPDAVQVQAVPLVLGQREGALLLDLQRVVGPQLDMLVLCQVLAAQADLLACRARGSPCILLSRDMVLSCTRPGLQGLQCRQV